MQILRLQTTKHRMTVFEDHSHILHIQTTFQGPNIHTSHPLLGHQPTAYRTIDNFYRYTITTKILVSNTSNNQPQYTHQQKQRTDSSSQRLNELDSDTYMNQCNGFTLHYFPK